MASVRTFSNIFSPQLLAEIYALPEVQTAKTKIDAQANGSVKFSIKITDELKHTLVSQFGIELAGLQTVPMRWIKGDTAPHIDTGATKFDNTYLAYLTNSAGELIVGEESYPIAEGAAYVFSEGIYHETKNTGGTPRLLLGPMNEYGTAVGSTGIYAPGGTTIYIRQAAGTTEYSSDQLSWNYVDFPCSVNNTNTSAGVLKIEFISDLTLSNTLGYFVATTSRIQFGSSSLKSDGTRPKFTINGVANYPGLISNADGNSNIYIYNLEVKAINGSTLSSGEGEGAGWIAQIYFATGAANNYIINCSSDGPIAQFCGGIVGSWAGTNNGQLTIIGCYSSGAGNSDAGGIAGTYAGRNGTLLCESCWSTGSIGTGAGGIIGAYGDGPNTISNCYSSGSIGGLGGGICGHDCNGLVSNCYSTGSCTSEGGCIGGKNTNCTYRNCYSTGPVLSTDAGGIVGIGGSPIVTNCYACGTTVGYIGYIIAGSSTVPLTCYSEAYNASGGTWNSTNANTVLTGTPSPVIGITWLNAGLNQPYELRAMGYTPYITSIITSTPSLQRTYSASVVAGNSTSAALLSGKSYTILEINGSSGSTVSITINATTGVVTVGSSTTPGTYTLYVRNTGSYNISTFVLTVTAPAPAPCTNCDVPCCVAPSYRHGPIPTNTIQTDLVAGNSLLGAARKGPMPYSALLAMRKAAASKR